MKFEIEQFEIRINKTENTLGYKKEYLFGNKNHIITKLDIKVIEDEIELNNAIIGSEGCGSSIHKTSQIIESDRILICCSNTIFCLDLPTLNLKWKTKVDEITAFEIFKINNGYIIHGELVVSRINRNGNILWQNGGAEIFVTPQGKNDFEIVDNFVIVKDWDNKTYKWDLNGNQIE